MCNNCGSFDMDYLFLVEKAEKKSHVCLRDIPPIENLYSFQHSDLEFIKFYVNWNLMIEIKKDNIYY
jgi:hypothetical protein